MSDDASNMLLIEKIRLMALRTIEDRIDRDLTNEFRYKILPKVKKEIAANIMAEIYEDDKSFTINITLEGDNDE